MTLPGPAAAWCCCAKRNGSSGLSFNYSFIAPHEHPEDAGRARQARWADGCCLAAFATAPLALGG